MIAYARASVLVGLIADVLAKFLAENFQKCRLGTGEKGLPDTTALVEELVVGYFLLVFVPVTFIF